MGCRHSVEADDPSRDGLPPLRRSDLSIAPRCPVIPSLRRSDLSARCARGPSGQVTPYRSSCSFYCPRAYREDTPSGVWTITPTEVGGIPRILTRSLRWWDCTRILGVSSAFQQPTGRCPRVLFFPREEVVDAEHPKKQNERSMDQRGTA